MTKHQTMGNMFGGEGKGGLFDIPRAEIGQIGDEKVVVFGAPIATPYATVGSYCTDAPNCIRSAFGWPGVGNHYDFDLEGTLLAENCSAVDWGDLPCSDEDFAFNRDLISNTVKNILDAGAVPMVLGGDDSIPIPVLQGYSNLDPVTVLQLDAHIDWRDEVQGEKLGLSSNMRRASEMPWVKNIIQIGARGAGSARPNDVSDAKEWGVNFFPMKSIQFSGMERSLEQITDVIEANANLYIALDIDVMDPAVVPGVIGPAPGGFSYYDVLRIFESVSKKARIVGFNLAEFMPSADLGNRGALVSSRITASLLGLIARQQ